MVVPLAPPAALSLADSPGPALEDLDDEISSLRALFRSRRMAIATMDRPLRLATAGALASLVGVVVLIALRDVKAPSVSLGRSGVVVVNLSLPLFLATLVLLSVGLAYLLTGAVLASWPVALASLVLITGMVGVETGAFGHLFGQAGFLGLLPAWARWSSRGLLAALWLVAGAVWLIDGRPGRREPTRRVRVVVLLAYGLIFGGYFAILRAASPDTGGLNVFPQVVGLLMEDIVLLVYPVLLVAAVDFGEWGGLLGERAAAAMRGRAARLLVPFAVLLSASLLVFGYVQIAAGVPEFSFARLWRAGRTVIILAAALAVIVGVGRALGAHRRCWPATLNFAAIFTVCAIGTYLIAPVSGLLAHDGASIGRPVEQVSDSGEFTAAADVISITGGAGRLSYTVLIPRGWVHNTSNGINQWTNYAVPGSHNATADRPFEQVLFAAGAVRLDATEAATGGGRHPTGAQVVDGPWTRVPFTLGAVPGLMWAQPGAASADSSYLVEEFASGVPVETVRPVFEAIAHSFRIAGQPAAVLPADTEQTPVAALRQESDRTLTVYIAIGAGVLLVLLAAVGLVGRRWSPRLVGTVLLFGMVTLASLIFFADSLGRTIGGAHARWPIVSQYGVLIGIGALGLLAMIAAARQTARRRRRLVIGLIALDATVWALQGMSTVYDHALSASRVSAWAAIIVLIAVVWDVTMSGESMTNHGTRHAPRASRVLAFLGYVILLAATVLFYSAQHRVSNGTAAEAFFEPEAVTRAGLFRIGLPVAVLLFLLRFGRARPAADQVSSEAP